MPDEFERTEAGYICLAQYMARAITLGIFGPKFKAMMAPSALRRLLGLVLRLRRSRPSRRADAELT